MANRYRVGGELGRGGMGVVLEAWPLVPSVHLRTDTPVALKLLLKAATDVDLRRFEREVQVTAQLDPAGVCAVYDTGALPDGTPFMVMELLDGEDLDQRLERDGCLPVVEAVDTILSAADILAEAHLLGLVHRDLKPSNLFMALTPIGPHLKLLDFGITKVLQGASRSTILTRTGELLGSPAYMAPEQLTDSGAVDHRIDIWALGAVLYELLSGRQPFRGQSLVELCQQVFTACPTPLDRPELAALEPVLQRCLDKDPDGRFPNLAELALALAPHAGPSGRRAIDRVLHRFQKHGWIRPKPIASDDHALIPTVTSMLPPQASAATTPTAETPAATPSQRLRPPRPAHPRRRWPLVTAGLLLCMGLGGGLYLGRRESRSRLPRDGNVCSGIDCPDQLHVDDSPSTNIPKATAIAKRVAADAMLVSVSVGPVAADGKPSGDAPLQAFHFNVPDAEPITIVLSTEGVETMRVPTGISQRAAVEGTPFCPLEEAMPALHSAHPESSDDTFYLVLYQWHEGTVWLASGNTIRSGFIINDACEVRPM